MLNLFQRTQCEAIIAGETEPHQRIEDEVETIIADRPPHRSVRALLRIRLPPWMSGKATSCRIRMQNAWGCKPPGVDRYEPISPRRSLTAAP
jgi:hypothetical protein